MRKKINNTIVHLLASLRPAAVIAAAVAIIVVVVVIWRCARSHSDDHLSVNINEKIDITPSQIRQIEDIGQWEVLQVSDEELVDTVSRNMFGDHRLARIYYGTLRLGIDMHKAEPRWLRVEGDTTIVAQLPKVELLDRDFIDEARTEAFFEEGSWTPADREHLYQKAYRKMLGRCLTKANITTAEDNARRQMTLMLRAMGFKNVKVEIKK